MKKYCVKKGIFYRTDRYFLNIKEEYQSIVSNYIGSESICPDQPFVEQMEYQKHIFISEEENLLFKCLSQMSEIEAYQKLGNHPNFLKFYGNKEDCMILEYLPNAVNLDSLREEEYPKLFHEIVVQSISALEYLHSKNLKHDDLHYGNILWDYDQDRIVIIDLEVTTDQTKRLYKDDNIYMVYLLLIIYDPFIMDNWEDVQEDMENSSIFDVIFQRLKEVKYMYPHNQEDIEMLIEFINPN